MDNTSVTFGSVTSYSDKHITIVSGDRSFTYKGNFNFDAYGNVSGQITGYDGLKDGSTVLEVSQLSLDAYSTFAAARTGDASPILQDAFSGDDDLFGSQENDMLIGHAGNDKIEAANGKDRLIGNAGNDTLDGGSGLDTAIYSGSQSSYTLTLSPTSTTVIDRLADGNGTDTLIDMELLDFDTEIPALGGNPLNLDTFGGTAGLSEQDFEAFIELYIAYFNRAPDAVGLNFWGSAFANGMSLDEIAAEFAPQPETVATYPEGTSNTEFVTTVYNNILGRGPDQGGLDFWVNGLEEGGLMRDTFILKLLGGVEDGNSDRAYLDSKVDIGAYFAVHKGMSDGENAKAVMDLFGDQDVSNTSGAKTAIDDYYTDALNPTNGEFLLQVVGVLDNPFDVA
jgi:hypothetical protein